MWRRTAYIIALGATLAACRKSSGQLEDYPELLITHLNWVRFDVVLGRVLATGHRTKQNRQTAHREHPCGDSETMSVTLDRGLVSFQYALVADNWNLHINAVRRDRLEIEWSQRLPDGSVTTITYAQPAHGLVSLKVRACDGAERIIQSPSLWHLVLSGQCEPDDPLLEILEFLRPDWKIQQEADDIRRALLETKYLHQATSRREIELLVQQLGSPHFRVRQRADRQLRGRGHCAICFLKGLDFSRLDAEQRYRVREIQASIAKDVVDSPPRVAAWLVNDMSVWLALLSDPDASHRAIAQKQLARLADRPIDFDPQAAERVRAARVAALHDDLLSR